MLVHSTLSIYYSPDTAFIEGLLAPLSTAALHDLEDGHLTTTSTKALKNLSYIDILRMLAANEVNYIYWINSVAVVKESVLNYTSLVVKESVLNYTSLVVTAHNHKDITHTQARSHYLTLAYFSAVILRLNQSTFIRRLSVAALPEKFSRPLLWPGIYIATLFVIMGCFIVNHRHMCNSYHNTVITARRRTQNSHTLHSIVSLFSLYNILAVLVHVVIIKMIIFQPQINIITKIKPSTLLFLFTVAFNTGLYTAFMISFLDFDIYVTFYIFTLYIYPQIFYIFCHGSTLGTSLYFQYATLISPIFAMSWIFVIIEDCEVTMSLSQKIDLLNDHYATQFSILTCVSVNFIYWILFSVILIVHSRLTNNRKISKRKKLTPSALKKHSKDIKARKKKYASNNSDTHSDSSYRLHSSTSFDIDRNANNQSTEDVSIFIPVSVVKTLSFNLETTTTTRTKKPLCLSVKKLTKVFKSNNEDVCALKNINMAANEYCITAIIGPNGSGKTTLVNILRGEVQPCQGIIKIDNKHVTAKNQSTVFRKVSVFTNQMIYFKFLTMKEYFQFVIEMENTNIKFEEEIITIKELVNILDLDDYFTSKLCDCPDFVLKQVQLLCTFIIKKPIVILDDPYSGFDFHTQNNINDLLVNRKNYQSIIVTSSKASNLESCADKIVLLINGKLVYQSKVIKLRNNRLGFKLICIMQKEYKNIDYSLVMFINSTYPEIRFEMSNGGRVQFSIPQWMKNQLEDVLKNVEKNANKCGVHKIKITTVDFRSHFHKLALKYNNFTVPYEHGLQMFRSSTILIEPPLKQSHFLKLYTRQFVLIFMQNIGTLYQFHNESTLSFLGPVFALVIFTTMAIFGKYTLITWTNLSMKSTEEFFFGYNPLAAHHFDSIRHILEYFSTEIDIADVVKNVNLLDFIDILNQRNLKLGLENVNYTKLAVYFDVEEDVLLVKIFSNFESYITKSFQMLQNYYLRPASIVEYFGNEDHMKHSLSSQKKGSHNSFFVRLVYIYIVLFLNNLFRTNIKMKLIKRSRIINLFGSHYSLCFLPHFLFDMILLFLFYGFMIMIIHILGDLDIITMTGEISTLVYIFILYGVTDIAFKSVIVKFLHSSSNILFLIVFDMCCFLVFTSSSVYSFKLIIDNYGYTAGFDCAIDDNIVQFLLKLLVPSINFHNALSMYVNNETEIFDTDGCKSIFHRRISSDNNSFSLLVILVIFIIQLIIYVILLFVVNNPRTRYISLKRSYRKFYNHFFQSSTLPTSTADRSAIISLDNVSYNENGVNKFSHINWAVYRNTLSMILGPNNSGKTILTEIIMGYRIPSSGDVYLRGVLLENVKVNQRQFKLSFCPQEPIIYEELSVFELFLFWAKVRCVPKGKINTIIRCIIKDLGLNNDVNKITGDLSYTCKKKVNIGISLIGFPDLIVLDDPLANLDTLSQQHIVSLLAAARSHRCTVILTTTEINDLYSITDKVLILNNYKIEYNGPWLTIPSNILIGYFITLIFNKHTDLCLTLISLDKMLTSKILNMRKILQKSMFIVYFMPAEDKYNVDYNRLIFQMENILSVNDDLIQYVICFNFMH